MSNLQQKKYLRKPGKTLLVNVTDDDFDTSVLSGFSGLDNHHQTESSKSWFLTFKDVEGAVCAFNTLRTNHGDSLKLKYAHYRVFFKMNGLVESSDYNEVKKMHIDFIEKNTNAVVLFYKLYRKENQYLDCGDFTIDVKDGFDSLVMKENGHKEFELNDTLSGIHYRYNRQNNTSTNVHA